MNRVCRLVYRLGVLLISLCSAGATTGCSWCGAGATADFIDSGSEISSSEPCVPLLVDEGTSVSERNRHNALFLITSLRFGSVGEGLDLDCTNSPVDCQTDICREAPEDGEKGVDNRLGPLALRLSKLSGSDLQDEMTQAVESGRHPLLIRLRGVDSFHQGMAESVELSFGLDVDQDHSDLTTGHGRVRPDPNAPSKRPSRFAPASIKNGVVSAGPTSDWMPLFWTRGQIAAVPVHLAYLRFRIAQPPRVAEADGGVLDDGGIRGDALIQGRLTEGLLAGAIYPNDLSQAILDMDARTAKVLQRLGPVVRALIRQQSDLDLIPPGPTSLQCEENEHCLSAQRCRAKRCAEPREHLDMISFAVQFEAVSVIETH